MKLTWNTNVLVIGNYTLVLSQLAVAAAILLLTFMTSALLRKGLQRMSAKKDINTAAQTYALGRILHYVLITMGALFAISSLGIAVGKLALIASALGIGIGLGLQSMVNNFVSGLVLLLERSVKVGDFIELANGTVGEVREINIRATLIRTNDNVDVLMPNSELVNSMVTNWTLEESSRRFRVPFAVAYGSDKNLVRKAALEASDQVECTLQTKGREPVVWMTGFGDSSLDFVLGVWVANEHVKRPVGLTSEYLWAIDDALHKYNIEIPFPQRDLHLRSDDRGTGASIAQ